MKVINEYNLIYYNNKYKTEIKKKKALILRLMTS